MKTGDQSRVRVTELLNSYAPRPPRIVERSLVYTTIGEAAPTAGAPLFTGLWSANSVAGFLDHVPGSSLGRARKKLGLVQGLLQVLTT